MAPRGSIPDISVDTKSNPGDVSSLEEGLVFSVVLVAQGPVGRAVSAIWTWEAG